MKKTNVVEQLAESVFNSPQFSEKWIGYLSVFGSEISDLFPDSHKARVALAAVLQRICDKKYEEARRDLVVYRNSALTEREKVILSRLIDLCTDEIPEATYPARSDRYMRYREMLINNRFYEAAKRYGHFYRYTTPSTAFVVNLYDKNDGVDVVYGFTSTVAMKGCENWFKDNGSDGESCQIRNLIRIFDNADEAEASDKMSKMYNSMQHYPKDWIADIKKARQKEFISHFAQPLKVLGFRKKGNRWTKILDSDNAISFEAQKSAYSDQYYFNVSIHSPSDYYARTLFERVILNDTDIYNWQLMTNAEIEELVSFSIDNHIKPKLK